MPQTFDENLSIALKTAFYDQNIVESDPNYRSQLLINDSTKGIKILTAIEEELKQCTSFDISVAFVTLGGIESLLMTLKQLEENRIPGRFLTTDYLFFSDPKALQKLQSFQNIQVRMFCCLDHGFHTKGYVFNKENQCRIILGSSNFTQTALTTNHEWNARIVSKQEGEFAVQIKEAFETLWEQSAPLDEVIDAYKREFTQHSQARKAFEEEEQRGASLELKPNDMQKKFVQRIADLYEHKTRRALLISATGTGKTYASAFGIRDGLQCKGKVLFLVHREQILYQAKAAYQRIFGSEKRMEILSGNSKDFANLLKADFVFATTTMMQKNEVLSLFDRKTFDAIVFDEVHFAPLATKNVLAYFEPKFALGMTATPDRTDQKEESDVYKLFDNNIAYEIRLKQAMEMDFLCPFHYFGIHDIVFDDDTFYNNQDLKYLGNRLFNRFIDDFRVQYILKQMQFFGFDGKRPKGLMFCSSVVEAEALSAKFNALGLRTKALSGGNSQKEREDAVNRLISDTRTDYLEYILTVDIFNVGIDIPEINQVVMLRPTQSAIVFIQQLGRGLRKFPNKEFVVILDFIGNYEANYLIPVALSGDRTRRKDAVRKFVREGAKAIPGPSTIHFDEVSKKRIYQAIDRLTTPLKKLTESYYQCKKRFGRVPSLVEFYRNGDIDPILFAEYKNTNKSWYRTYYNFVTHVDKETKSGLEKLTAKENCILEFITTQFAYGQRPHELLMLKQLHQTGQLNPHVFAMTYSQFCGKNYNQKDYDSALNVLRKGFLTETDARKYSLVNFWDDSFVSTNTKVNALAKDIFSANISSVTQFHFAVDDIIDYGLMRFKDLYSKVDQDNFVLYQKYSRREACRLLNWSKDISSTIYGYTIKDNVCPIFVTYSKADTINPSTAYDDRFLSQELFNWMTRNRVKETSKESQTIIHQQDNGLKIFLFIKKSDDEGSDFYYMGRLKYQSHKEVTIQDATQKILPITNFVFRMHNPVSSDMFEYFTK